MKKCDEMLLTDEKRLKKANELLDSGEIIKYNNAIWFAKYLISEYVKANDMELFYNFTPSYQMDGYTIDGIGVHRNSMMSNMHDMLVQNSMKINQNDSLESLFWYYFLSLGHDVVVNDLSKNMMNNIFSLDNPAGYTQKQYSMYKEALVANVISDSLQNQYRETWLNFSEAAIVGGEIFLSIVKDNFADKEILFNVRNYFEKRVQIYKMKEYSALREELVRTIDSVIMRYPQHFMDQDSDLIVEFNYDGTKKNIFQLLEIYKRVIDNLQLQLESTDNQIIRDKVSKAMEMQNHLMENFIYNSLGEYGDEAIRKLFCTLDEDELLIVEKSIQFKDLEVQAAINFIESSDDISPEEKEQMLMNWKFEETDCLRLNYIIEESKKATLR